MDNDYSRTILDGLKHYMDYVTSNTFYSDGTKTMLSNEISKAVTHVTNWSDTINGLSE